MVGKAGTFDDAVKSTAATVPDEGAGPGLMEYTQDMQFGQGDLAMPFLRLAQGLSEEVTTGSAQMGEYLVSGFEPEAEVVFIPGRFRVSRVYRDDDGILCQSTDARGLVGKGIPGGDCSICPLAQWTSETDKRGKQRRVQPACSQGYVYEGFSLTHGMPVKVDFRKTGLDAGKLLNTLVQVKKLGSVAVKLKGTVVKTDKGTYAKHTVTLAQVSPDDLGMVQEIFGLTPSGATIAAVTPKRVLELEAVAV